MSNERDASLKIRANYSQNGVNGVNTIVTTSALFNDVELIRFVVLVRENLKRNKNRLFFNKSNFIYIYIYNRLLFAESMYRKILSAFHVPNFYFNDIP